MPKQKENYTFRILYFFGIIMIVAGQDVLHIRIDAHGGQWAWIAGKLEFYLLEMIHVDVCIAQGVDEVAGFQTCNLCHHHQQQCVANTTRNWRHY